LGLSNQALGLLQVGGDISQPGGHLDGRDAKLVLTVR
jgi:hypothetical protein